MAQQLGEHHRILMLVPHDPELDPRIRWVTSLCKNVGRIDILGFVYHTNSPSREYDGVAYTERILAVDYPKSPLLKLIEATQLLANPRLPLKEILENSRQSFLRFLGNLKHSLVMLRSKVWDIVRPFLERSNEGKKIVIYLKAVKAKSVKARIERLERENLLLNDGDTNIPISPVELIDDFDEAQSSPEKGQTFSAFEGKERRKFAERIKNGWLRNYLDSVFHWLNIIYGLELISNTLFQRARAVSIIPKVLICHDIYALKAAVKLKKLFGLPVIYDSHELWPEADLQALPWERNWILAVEKRLVRDADVVITVTPQLATHLEKIYKIRNVLCIPNAEPLPSDLNKPRRKLKYPIRFLLQGQASPGRGIEEFLDVWQLVEDERAVLVLRCPENPFLAYLRQKYRTSTEKGRLKFVPPVSEVELVQAAYAADIGIIPYRGPNLNHVYACPNKLSQYMQAGLGIFHHSDQIFVSQLVKKYQCGLSFDTNRPDTVVSGVSRLVNNLDLLENYQKNSFMAVLSEFNWDAQATPYLDVIKHFYYR